MYFFLRSNNTEILKKGCGIGTYDMICVHMRACVHMRTCVHMRACMRATRETRGGRKGAGDGGSEAACMYLIYVCTDMKASTLAIDEKRFLFLFFFFWGLGGGLVQVVFCVQVLSCK